MKINMFPLIYEKKKNPNTAVLFSALDEAYLQGKRSNNKDFSVMLKLYILVYNPMDGFQFTAALIIQKRSISCSKYASRFKVKVGADL